MNELELFPLIMGLVGGLAIFLFGMGPGPLTRYG